MSVPLNQVQIVHDWLEGKRQSRQSGRVVGESRTGKTMACDAYRLRHKPQQVAGKAPTVPVIYLQVPQECGAKELFSVILEHLKYQVTRGTVAEIRERTFRVIKGCAVEMLIIDEADRLKPKTFAEVRDIFDKLEISVILVGTDRLDAVIKKDGVAELGYDSSPSPRQILRLWLPSPKFGRGVGGEGKIYASYLDSATPLAMRLSALFVMTIDSTNICRARAIYSIQRC